MLSVGLESPPGLVVESLTSSILREIAAVGIQITVEGDPDVNVIQLGLHPIVIGDQVWILRALQAIRSSPHAICAAHDAGTDDGSWTGPIQLGLDTTNASARALGVETIEVGIRLFNYCAEQLAGGNRLSDTDVWGMRLWWP